MPLVAPRKDIPGPPNYGGSKEAEEEGGEDIASRTIIPYLVYQAGVLSVDDRGGTILQRAR